MAEIEQKFIGDNSKMKKCLVSDNNIFYLEFFKDILSSFGYEVTTATDGIMALEMARDGNFDLFLFDYVMPKVDGIRLARYIREIDKYKETPIILITAAALESVNIGDNKDIDLFIAKAPFEKMRDIFNNVIPNIEQYRHKKDKSVLGLENIYPRQIVKELLVTELNYSVILHSLVEGILELDEADKAVFVNKSFCDIVGKMEHEIIGHSIAEIFDFDSHREIKEAFYALKAKNTLHKESLVHQISGKTVHMSLYNIIGGPNRRNGSFIILNDVTEIRDKVFQISSIFNITQAFLSNLPYKDVLQYVVYELRRLINATNISILFACDGIFKGERISASDRKVSEGNKRKIEFWINKIEEWKRSGLINVKTITKLTKIKFEDMPILWLPLVFKEMFLGSLIGFKKTDSEFSEEEIRFFEAVGNQLAIYMANEERLEKGRDRELRKFEVEGTYTSLLDKINFMKWEEMNKKNVLSLLTEKLNRDLTIIKSCFDVIEKDSVLNDKYHSVCNNFSNSFNGILNLKEDLGILCKIGNQDESDFTIFSLDMIIEKLKKVKEFNDISFPSGDFPAKWIGDFDRIVFFLKIILLELLRRNAQSISIEVEPKNSVYILTISFSGENNAFFEPVFAERRDDIIDNLYFAYHELKSALEFLNAKVSCTIHERQYKISIVLPTTEKGDGDEKI